MKTLAERMAWARKRLDISQVELARKADVSQSAIGNLEAGLRKSSRSIAAIAKALQVDAYWLETGAGTSDVKREQQVIPFPEFSRNVRAINDEDPNEKLQQIRKVKLKLSAGIVGFAIDQEQDDGNPIYLGKDWLALRGYKPQNLIATDVKGPSMEPVLYDGDTVVFNTADTEPKDGVIFAVNYEGECVIKRLTRDGGTWWLSSDNPDQRRFSRKECGSDLCIILGRVVHRQSEIL